VADYFGDPGGGPLRESSARYFSWVSQIWLQDALQPPLPKQGDTLDDKKDVAASTGVIPLPALDMQTSSPAKAPSKHFTIGGAVVLTNVKQIDLQNCEAEVIGTSAHGLILQLPVLHVPPHIACVILFPTLEALWGCASPLCQEVTKCFTSDTLSLQTEKGTVPETVPF
jgi:hypothetical protein